MPHDTRTPIPPPLPTVTHANGPLVPRHGLDTSQGHAPGRHAAPRYGTLTVITGPMYSGKSSALVDRVERVARASRNAVVLRPARDTRTTALLTHAGRGIAQGLARFVTELRVPIAPPGHRQAGAGVAWPRVSPDVRLVALDEVQFLPAQPVVAFVAAMQARGFDVVCAGLDLDSRGVPFDTVAALLALADTVVKSTAVCVCCGADARRSQRITRDTARVSVGGEGQYEARCRECWQPDTGDGE